MNFEHFVNELRQIQLIQKKLIEISDKADKQETGHVIDSIESQSKLTAEIIDNIESGKIKSPEEFLTMLNHELRTPLVPVLTYADMLYQEKFGKLNHEQKKRVEAIALNAKELQEKITTLINKNTFERGGIISDKTNHQLHELKQEILLLKKINDLLSEKKDFDKKEVKNFENYIIASRHKQKELEQEKLLLAKSVETSEHKIRHLSRRHYLVIAIIAMSVSAGFATYSYYQNQLLIKATSNLTNYNSNYVIQNLRGDVVHTWVAWNLVPDQILHVNIVNNAGLSSDKINAIKDAILSTKTTTVDDALLHEGPSGTSSTRYEGWVGAVSKLVNEPSKYQIPSKFDISENGNGAGDIVITLTTNQNPDGLSGLTKSVADGNQILKSKITIYNADKLSAFELSSITRHEFGHALGLAHSSDPNDLMHAVIQTDYPYISGCDIAAIQGLYDGDERSQVICQ